MRFILPFVLGLFLFSCGAKEEQPEKIEVKEDSKIVSLNGTLTEILCEADLGKNIVGVDVTSVYPENINSVPKVGHVKSLNAEGIIGLNPTIVIGKEDEIKPELVEQLKSAGIQVYLFKQEYTVDGTKNLVNEVCAALKKEDLAKNICQQIDEDLKAVTNAEQKPKVLFIYARGAGTLMVAGENTQMQSIIEFAGGENAAKGFSDFKPLTPEALLEANPDILLMFSSGVESLSGNDGVWEIPGMLETNAGKNKALISMDGLYISGFGPRLGKAIVELNNHFKQTQTAEQTN